MTVFMSCVVRSVCLLTKLVGCHSCSVLTTRERTTMSHDVEMAEAALRVRRSPRLQKKAVHSSPLARMPIECSVATHVVGFVSRATQTECWTCDRGVQVSAGIDQMTSVMSPIKRSMRGDTARSVEEYGSPVMGSPVRSASNAASTPTRSPCARAKYRKDSVTSSPDSLTDEPRTPSSANSRRHVIVESQPETTKEHLFLMPTPLMSPSVQRSLKLLAATPVRGKSGQSWTSTTPDLIHNRRPMGTASRSTPRRSYSERTRRVDEDSAPVSQQLSSSAERKQNRRPGSSDSAVYSWLADKEKRATAMLKSAMRDVAQRKKQDTVRERRVSWGSTSPSPVKRRRVDSTTNNKPIAAATKVMPSSSSRSLLMVAAALKTQGQDRPETPATSPETVLIQDPQTVLPLSALSPSRSPVSSMTRLSLLSPKNERGRTT